MSDPTDGTLVDNVEEEGDAPYVMPLLTRTADETIAAQAKEIELLKGLINEVLHAKEDGAFDWAMWDKQATEALEAKSDG